MVDLVCCSTDLLFFDIPLINYYINFNRQVFFLEIFLLVFLYILFFSNVSELFCSKFLETFVILSAILLPIKSTVASAVFLFAFLMAVLSGSAADYLVWSRSFWLYLLLKFSLIFLPIFLPMLLAKDKKPNLLQIFNL